VSQAVGWGVTARWRKGGKGSVSGMAVRANGEEGGDEQVG